MRSQKFQLQLMIHKGDIPVRANVDTMTTGSVQAVPSSIVIHEVPALIQNGTYTHPWLGMAGDSINPYLAQSAGLPINYKGVVMASIQPGSPAEKEGRAFKE